MVLGLFGIVLLSMWTNLLARTYAWMVLLQRTGAINKLLIGMGLIDGPCRSSTTWSGSRSA